MGGYHVPNRDTNSQIYVAIASKLQIPSEFDCVSDSSGQYDGIFPEFFHGFYKGSTYGIDIGVIYRNKKWMLSFHALNKATKNPQDPLSGEEKVVSLTAGQTYVLKSSLVPPNYLRTSIETTGGSVLGIFDIYITQNAYNAFAAGAAINRECCIAANRNPYIPSAAYYKNAKFFESTLTTTSGTYVKMSTSNSRRNIYSDDGTIDSTRYRYSESETNGYVSDTSSISFRNPIGLP